MIKIHNNQLNDEKLVKLIIEVLKYDEYPDSVSLSADDQRVIKYLKGETIELPEFSNTTNKGWVLFCVDRYPLGWGKYDGYSLKNKYLAGWRWM